MKESEVDEMKAEKERERLAMMLIDWHEFSVVRTIDFDPNEDVSRLGPPLTKQMVIQLNKGVDAEAGALIHNLTKLCTVCCDMNKFLFCIQLYRSEMLQCSAV